MRHKELILKRLESLDNDLTGLGSLLNYAKTVTEIKDKIWDIKDKLKDVQTLINTEGDDWK